MTIGDSHDLRSPRFAGDPSLEACYDKERYLRKGNREPAVQKIQQALIDSGFPLPRFGADGIFGDETDSGLKNYQRARGLKADGIVGPLTMERLDEDFASSPVTPAAKGLALTIGLNSVDPGHYGGWSGELIACEADANDMADIAKSQMFKVTTLLTKDATRENVTKNIQNAAKTLKSGDIFMFSYSGHGGQLPDLNNDEPDGMDETMCLYNGQLEDDELYALWGEFGQGVRILVFSDSCHSGTVTKAANFREMINLGSSNVDIKGVKYRLMPQDIALRTYRANREFYDPILKNQELKESRQIVKATVLLISGCMDNQLSADGTFNGLFTSQLLSVWKNGLFNGNYRNFHNTIVKRMPQNQTPNYYIVGLQNPSFENQKPFTI